MFIASQQQSRIKLRRSVMSWMMNMPLLRSLIVNHDNQAINIRAPTERRLIQYRMFIEHVSAPPLRSLRLCGERVFVV